MENVDVTRVGVAYNLVKEKIMIYIAAKALGKLMRLLCLHEAYVNKFVLVINTLWLFASSNNTSEFRSGV
jgi:hypothetical protein